MPCFLVSLFLKNDLEEILLHRIRACRVDLGGFFVAMRNKEKECLLDKKQRNLIATESLDCYLLECANLAEFKLNFPRRGLFLGSKEMLVVFSIPLLSEER